MIEPMTDVSRVAVAEQVNIVPARRIRVGGKEPAVQRQTVGRPKSNVLEWAPQFAAARLQFAVRVINLSMFKPAQHRIYDRNKNQRTDGRRGPSLLSAVRQALECQDRP